MNYSASDIVILERKKCTMKVLRMDQVRTRASVEANRENSAQTSRTQDHKGGLPRVGRHLPRLLREVVDSSSLKLLQVRLFEAVNNLL